jgi:hypothetical protein
MFHTRGHWVKLNALRFMNVRAKRAAHEYDHRFCCEEGFRDAKGYLGPIFPSEHVSL